MNLKKSSKLKNKYHIIYNVKINFKFKLFDLF